MTTVPKITEEEWRKFVDPQMEARGLNRLEREAIKGAFTDDLRDVDFGEHQPLFGKPIPGITQKELEDTIGELRNPYSDKSKSLKTHVHPTKLDVAEKILQEALKGDKGGSGFF